MVVERGSVEGEPVGCERAAARGRRLVAPPRHRSHNVSAPVVQARGWVASKRHRPLRRYRMRCRSVEALLASGAVVAVAVVGCAGTSPSGAAPAVGGPPASNGLITVQVDNIACTLSSDAVPAGPLTFN